MNKNSNKLQLAIYILLVILAAAVLADVIIVRSNKKDIQNEIQTSEDKKKNQDKETEEESMNLDEPALAQTVKNNKEKAESSPKPDEYYYADVYSYLSIRENPDINSTVLYEVPGYTELLMLTEKEYPMVYVKVVGGNFNGCTGYVNKEYIAKRGEQPKRIDTHDECLVVSGVREYLPLRTSALFDDTYEIERLYNGDKVLLVENLGGDFWYVRSVKSGNVGYVVNKYLKKY